MATQHTCIPLLLLHMQPAQQAWEHLPCGADVVVESGTVCIHSHRYLAGAWVAVPVLLRTGEQHRMLAGGWVVLQASTAARVRVTTAPSLWQMWRAWWARRRSVASQAGGT